MLPTTVSFTVITFVGSFLALNLISYSQLVAVLFSGAFTTYEIFVFFSLILPKTTSMSFAFSDFLTSVTIFFASKSEPKIFPDTDFSSGFKVFSVGLTLYISVFKTGSSGSSDPPFLGSDLIVKTCLLSTLFFV